MRVGVFDWARSDTNNWRILSEEMERAAAVRTRPKKPVTIMGRLNWWRGVCEVEKMIRRSEISTKRKCNARVRASTSNSKTFEQNQY